MILLAFLAVNLKSQAAVGSLITAAAIVLSGVGFAGTVSAGEGLRATAWPDRAEAAVQLFVEANAQQLANSIQRIAHPEGKRPELLANREISKVDDRILVKIAVSWNRGPGSRNYTTWVAWEFSEKSHLQARVVSDSASMKITAKNSALLDDHFREKIYPAISRAATGRNM
jgi:hypothetical protein